MSTGPPVTSRADGSKGAAKRRFLSANTKFLLARLTYAREDTREDGWRYHVLPGAYGHKIKLAKLSGWVGFEDFLSSVVSAGLEGAPAEGMGEVFWLGRQTEDAHLRCLEGLASSKDVDSVTEVLFALLRHSPVSLAITYPEFANRILEAVSGKAEALKDIHDALVISATPQHWSRAPGKPAPIWLKLRDDCLRLSGDFAGHREAVELFQSLQLYAERRLADPPCANNL